MVSDLTPKQRKFVSAYLELGNGVAAARAAGYKGNAKTLSVVSSENLAKPCIQQALSQAMEAAQVTEEKIVKELAVIALSPAQDEVRMEHKLQGLKLLAKIQGMLKQENAGPQYVSTMNYRQLTQAVS